ncbi:MAG TPA: cytochrome c [Ignavibacteria bacterium]|nr:cytochrome c [Ignavibacteria bacterium]
MDNIRDYNIEQSQEVIPSKKERLGFTWIYAAVYVVILLIIVSAGTMYLSKLGYMTSNKLVPFTVSDTGAVITMGDLQVKKGSISPPVDVFKYENPGPDVIETGKQLYASNCASCHGETGDGKGPAGASLNPPPRNFTNMEGWKNGPTIEGMYKTLQEGIPNTGMAAFANLPPEQRLALISYMRTFSAQFPPVTNADLQNMENVYKLSEGQKEPNQIPVGLAIQKMLEEYKPTAEQISNALNKVQGDNSPGAMLLKSVSTDLERTIISMVADNSWAENESSFISFVSTNPIQKGFKGRVDDLTAEEWSSLYGYLRSVININVDAGASNENQNETQNGSQDTTGNQN